MKRCALIFFVFMFVFFKNSVAQKLAFSYDASGNQTERRWVCINCPSARSMDLAKKLNLEGNLDLENGELVNGRQLKVFPNPLSETLNVTWKVQEKLYLKGIDVLSMGGNRVFSASYKSDERQTQISFGKLPPGTYLMIAKYSDSQTETIKLIKI